jgi:hypothetical protein
MKKILILSALATFLGIVGAAANPWVTQACQIFACQVNGG